MTFTNTIKVDVGHPWKTAQVYVKQGDKDSRKIRAELMNGAASWTIPVGTVATFRAKKPDDTVVTQDATIGSPNIVEVVLDEQVGAVFGVVRGEIRLVNGGEILNTFLIAINVEAAAVTDGDIVSRDVLDEYQALVDQMLAVAGSPLVANAAADMTDKTRVYVYTGSEVGYVNGDWYYWDGAAWTAGGAYNSQGISDAFIEQTADYIRQSTVATESDSVPYLYRPAPNPSAILADEEIVGGTVAHNQLVKNGNFADGTDEWGVNNASGFSVTSGVASFTATANGGRLQSASNSSIPIRNGHKFITLMTVNIANNANFRIYGVAGKSRDVVGTGAFAEYSIAEEATADGTKGYFPRVTDTRASGWTEIKATNFFSTDLTAMFGTTIADYLYTLESNTPGTGVAKLREWGFLRKIYSPYNAGSLVSVNTEGKEVVGFNLWNETWELGRYSTGTGAKEIRNNAIRSADYISIKPGSTIYVCAGYSSSAGVLLWYDENKTFISCQTNGLNVERTAPSNAHYMTFYIAPETTYKHNVCVNYSTAGMNGVYRPYRQPTFYPTAPTDLNGIFKLDSNNNLYADGDRYKADGTVTRTLGKERLGDLSWTYYTAQDIPFFYADINDGKHYTSTSQYVPLICGRYLAENAPMNAGPFAALGYGHIAANVNAGSHLRILVSDSGYTSADTFKTAMDNADVEVVYELATPTTETATPYTATQIVGKGGTEEWIDNRSVPVPVGHETVYGIGVPDVPATASNATLKATVSGGKTTLSWS